MPFKNDYLTTVGVTPATYTSGASAANRICGIYSTARTGRISAIVGDQLWISFFAPLVSHFSALPATQAGYDVFPRTKCCDWQNYFGNAKEEISDTLKRCSICSSKIIGL
jgi:hypothetical protein